MRPLLPLTLLLAVPLVGPANAKTPEALPVAAVEEGAAAAAEWSGPSGYEMVGIAAGSFTMGSLSSEKGRQDDETEHRVTLTRGFWMGKTEVTQELWRAVMGRVVRSATIGTSSVSVKVKASTRPSPGANIPFKKAYEGVSLLGDRLPVQNVSWCDAVAFANLLSARDGLSEAYSGVEQCHETEGASVSWDTSTDGYRLPTEAEWEYAARAGEHRLFAGAESYEAVCKVGNVSDIGAAARFDWSEDWSKQCTDDHHCLSAVGTYGANAWGLYDMTGNVREWCWDTYGDYSGTITNPVAAGSLERWEHEEEGLRVSRGGSWSTLPRGARVTYRQKHTPTSRSHSLGLRLVRTAPIRPSAAQLAAKEKAAWGEEHQVLSAFEGLEVTGTQQSATLGKLVCIGPGSFGMGSSADEVGRGDDETLHRVTLTKGFCVMETEVTQGMYKAAAREEKKPSWFKMCGRNCPVEYVSWLDAVVYANEVSSLEGLSAAYEMSGDTVRLVEGATGYRLLTEAEWEAAARGRESHVYSGSSTEDSVAWTRWNSGGHPQRVKGLSANGYGLYDMTGNVGEWTWDWYAESYGSDVQTDPHGPVSGSKRVFRGGGWSDFPADARVATRSWSTASDHISRVGFRLARTAD